MGKKPDEVQREVEECRRRLDRRVSDLEQRVRTDVTDAGHTLAADVTERTGLKTQAETRPLTTLMGAFGTGMLLGVASGGGGGKRGYPEPYRDAGNGNGLLGELLGSASGLLGGTLQDEFRRVLDQAFGEPRQPQSRPEPAPADETGAVAYTLRKSA